MNDEAKINRARILVSVGNETIAQKMALSLTANGYEVVGTVATAEEAIQAAEQTQPDLILMDVNRISASQSICSRCDAPVIYVTNFDEDGSLERVKRSHPYGFLVKPVRAADLNIAIEMALFRRQTDQQLKKSEHRSRSVVDNLQDFVFVLDESGTFVEYHHAPDLQVFDVNREEIIGRHYKEVLPHSVICLLEGAIRALTEGSSQVEQFSYLVNSAGKENWYNATVSKQKDSSWRSGAVSVVCRDITSQRQTQDELRRSEERFRLISEHANLGIFTTTPDGTFLSANLATAKLNGYDSVEEFLKTRAQDLYADPADREQVVGEILKNGYVRNYEFNARIKDGTLRAAILNAVIQKDPRDGTVTILGLVEDISQRKSVEEALKKAHDEMERRVYERTAELADLNEKLLHEIDVRKKAEAALKESESRYRQIIENSLTGIFIHQDGRAVFGNQRLADMMRCSKEELIGMSIWDGIHHDDREIVGARIQARLRGEPQTVPYQLRLVNNTGEVIWCDILATSIDYRGRSAIMGNLVDVTKRKQAEEALRKSEEKYRLLFEKATDSILIIGVEGDNLGRVVACNPVAAQMRGYEMEELLALRLDDIETPEANQKKTERIERILNGEWLQEEITHRRKDGSVLPIEISAGLIEYGGNKCVLSFERDISDRKRAQQKNESLRSQLIQSQKMEAVGTLAAGIAHDFNNMLQVIVGYSDLLLDERNEGEFGYEELQRIIRTAEEAKDLVQKIRIFSRKADMQPVPLDLNHRINQLSKMLIHTVSKAIHIVVRLTDNVSLIRADASLVDQMVMNLAINAAEAMPDGGILTIETQNMLLEDDFCRSHSGLRPGAHVLLTVSDTGKGINKELISKIFDPFFSTKQRDYRRGTGLGLSVVQGIVEEHNGHISFQSVVGKGTTFKIYFPLLKTQDASNLTTIAGVPLSGTETILFVEDEELVRDVGVALLERSGYRVLAAADGREAIEMYQKKHEHISLVILDIVMPRMNGKECLQELLKINPLMKVLISSGVAQQDLVKDVVDLGAKGAIIKPYKRRTLLERVRETLDAN